MKKIFIVASLAAGLTLITSCSVTLSECEKNSDYNNTIYRGRNTHNFIVLNNKLDKILKNQEQIIEQNEESSDYNNTIYRGRNTHNFIVINNKLDKVLENQEHIKEQNKEMLEILRKQ